MKLIFERTRGYSAAHNPHKRNISNHLDHLNKGLDVYLKSYGNILRMGGLNSKVTENCLNIARLKNCFCNINSLKTLIREGSNMLQNPSNPSCIDLFPTNRPHFFQQTCTLEAVFLTSTKRLLL